MEGVYLIHTRELFILKKEIYKIGRSHDMNNRMIQYPRDSQVMFMFACENSILCEQLLIALFKTKFIQAKYYGSEYFEGSLDVMIKTMLEFLYKNLINKINKIKNNLSSVNIISNEIVDNIVNENDNNNNSIVVSNTVNVGRIVSENFVVVPETVVVVLENVVVVPENVVVVSGEVVIKDNKDRTCPDCSSIFNFPSDLKKHLINSSRCKKPIDYVHDFFNKINKSKSKINSNTIIYKCIYCNHTYVNKYILQRHKDTSGCGIIW